MINFEELSAYELLRRQDLPDILSVGYLLRHKKSGARVVLIENEDENKVFNIAFRTTPSDSTGVAHIMEHSVLCGSQKFPAKDPFVELVKGSMNTFLNAMTYPDKTMYPVASCNDTDFANLMHVYLDAVFFPNIYRKEEIFRQEGWSYQLENADDPLVINGVVYNEMKGAFSSPDDVLERQILNELYPDTTYHYESGGDPDVIPELSYEDFLNFHRRFYHPSNAYLYLYGKMDFAERLDWIDRAYLSGFEVQPVDSAITLQEPFDHMHRATGHYSISSEDSLENNTYLSWAVSIGTSLDTRLANAFAVLEYALLETPGAPLREALFQAGIGEDIDGSFDSSIRQPIFEVTAKGANAEDEERFLAVIRETLEKVCDEGLDEKSLLAAINLMEFRFREADYGSYPKGLIYGINLFDSWLYDENEPFGYLMCLNDYAFLREQIGTSYYADLIRTCLLDNPHSVLAILLPERGMADRAEADLAARLAEKKAAMTEDEIAEMIRRTGDLRRFQETPSTQEELSAIPMLSREDMRKKSVPFRNEVRCAEGGAPILHHAYDANGIAYIQILLDASAVAPEDLPYLGILRGILGFVDTEHYGYADLSNEINCRTGGIVAGVSTYLGGPDNRTARLALGMQIRTLFDEIPFCFDMAQEILFTSDLRQEDRLRELTAKMRSRTQSALQEGGNATAVTRSLSHTSAFSYLNDGISGVAFYRVLQKHADAFEETKEELMDRLRSVLDSLLREDGLLVSYTGSAEEADRVSVLTAGLAARLREEAEKKGTVPGKDAPAGAAAADAASEETLRGRLRVYPAPAPEKCSEGFKTPAKVQYVARTGNFKQAGFAFTGAMRVLRTIMSYDYLWSNVRVVGGAYGCGASFGRSGDTAFASYRDPHLSRTNEVYEGIPEYLEKFEVDDRDMTKYVIGTMSDIDMPMSPKTRGSRSLSGFLEGLTLEDLQRTRDQILSVTQEDIRALAAPMRAVLDQGNLCVLGGEEKVESAKELFDSIQVLQ